MARYTHRLAPKVIAHRIGDSVPDWVMDLVSDHKVVITEFESADGTGRGVMFSTPNIIAGGQVQMSSRGCDGDYIVLDGDACSIVPAREFECRYDRIDDASDDAAHAVPKDTGSDEVADNDVLNGIGVISKADMEAKIRTEVPDAILIGSPAERMRFYPAIIGIDHDNHRVIYDRDMLVQQVYRRSDCTWDEAEEYVAYNIERSIEGMGSDKHAPLIVERQECY